MIDLFSLLDSESIHENTTGQFFIENFSQKKKISIESIIDKFSENLNKITFINQDRIQNRLVSSLQNNENKILTDNIVNSFDYAEYDPDDILIDMKYKSKYIKKFMDHIIKKHEENSGNNKDVILSRLDEEKNHNPDDIVCLICNDGDYEDNDLIVYCSKCQMTVHQLCYGIIDIPEEDWLCYPCQFHSDEKSKEIECILCPIKGGAMKPSCLKLKSSFCTTVMNYRKKCIRVNCRSGNTSKNFLKKKEKRNYNNEIFGNKESNVVIKKNDIFDNCNGNKGDKDYFSRNTENYNVKNLNEERLIEYMKDDININQNSFEAKENLEKKEDENIENNQSENNQSENNQSENNKSENIVEVKMIEDNNEYVIYDFIPHNHELTRNSSFSNKKIIIGNNNYQEPENKEISYKLNKPSYIIQEPEGKEVSKNEEKLNDLENFKKNQREIMNFSIDQENNKNFNILNNLKNGKHELLISDISEKNKINNNINLNQDYCPSNLEEDKNISNQENFSKKQIVKIQILNNSNIHDISMENENKTNLTFYTPVIKSPKNEFQLWGLFLYNPFLCNFFNIAIIINYNFMKQN